VANVSSTLLIRRAAATRQLFAAHWWLGVLTRMRKDSVIGEKCLSFPRLRIASIPGGILTNNIHISNHSYGFEGGWFVDQHNGGVYWLGDEAFSQSEDWHFGFYSDASQSIDEIVYSAVTYVPVFSSGNERDDNAPGQQPVVHRTYTNGVLYTNSVTSRPKDGGTSGYQSMTDLASAKNNITVGSVYKIAGGYAGSVSIPIDSSWGPTDDGRIKPDLVAVGEDIYTTGPSSTNSYLDFNRGTSYAAPAVTGTLGLLIELHDRLQGTNQPMLGSTLKGLVLHTADKSGGPDYQQGWGLLNAASAALLLTNNHASESLAHIKEVRLTSGDYVEFPVVATNTVPLRVSIAWTDPAGTPPAPSLNPTNLMLVNDLDLRVISPSGVTNFPWVLDGANPGNAATTGDNIRDPVERVEMATPTDGTDTVRITHKRALLDDTGATNSQRISIFVSGNVPQPPTPPRFTEIAMVSSNAVALKWASDVGRTYKVQHTSQFGTNAAATVWNDSTGELSATKTNTAVMLTVAATNAIRFFRLVQLQ